MATNTNTTHTPGTVKGTARVTTTELRPGMTIRFSGPRARSSRYTNDVNRGKLTGFGEIVAVTSELRNPGSAYARRTRWYVVSFTDGSQTSLAPATRHDVVADSIGAPVENPYGAADAAARTADGHRTRALEYATVLDRFGLGSIFDDCHENTTDRLGQEPSSTMAPGAVAWWKDLADSIWSEADAQGLDVVNPPAVCPAETHRPTLTLVLAEHHTQSSLF